MRTVEKALDIMETILKGREPIGLADLAKAAGLNRTTVHRISAVLVRRGYLYQKGRGEKYSLGLKFLQYSNVSSTAANIREQAMPYLQNLCDEVSETVNMAILDGIEPISIGIVAADRILQVVPNVVHRFPLHCTALGKILLAYIPDGKIENILRIIKPTAYTEHTITDLDHLRREIKAVRRAGVAFDDEEYVLGIRSAAAPVRGEDGHVLAAVSFVGPSVRVSKARMAQLAPTVKDYALQVSRVLGYREETGGGETAGRL